eukprot:gene8483-9387_t
MAALACLVLDNICLDCGDTIPSKLDLTMDPTTSEKRDRATIRDLLLMNSSRKVFDANENRATKVRRALEVKVANELKMK